MTEGLRGWWAVVVQARTAPATGITDRATLMVNEQAGAVGLLESDDDQSYPQRWSPVRPGLRDGAAARFEFPYGSAARATRSWNAAARLSHSTQA